MLYNFFEISIVRFIREKKTNNTISKECTIVQMKKYNFDNTISKKRIDLLYLQLLKINIK